MSGAGGEVIQPSACWLPGLFWLNDFTVPGVATSRGDGKNPATQPDPLPRRSCITFAFLPPSSFGPRFRSGKQKKPLLGLIKPTIRGTPLFHLVLRVTNREDISS